MGEGYAYDISVQSGAYLMMYYNGILGCLVFKSWCLSASQSNTGSLSAINEEFDLSKKLIVYRYYRPSRRGIIGLRLILMKYSMHNAFLSIWYITNHYYWWRGIEKWQTSSDQKRIKPSQYAPLFNLFWNINAFWQFKLKFYLLILRNYSLAQPGQSKHKTQPVSACTWSRSSDLPPSPFALFEYVDAVKSGKNIYFP